MRSLQLEEIWLVSAGKAIAEFDLMTSSMAAGLCVGLLALFIPLKTEDSLGGGLLSHMILFPAGAFTGGILGPLVISQLQVLLSNRHPPAPESRKHLTMRGINS